MPAPFAMTAASVARDGGYGDWSVNLVVVAVALVVVAACVILHYEGLNLLSRRFATAGGRRRRRVLSGIFAVLVLHVAEIWLFGVAFYLLLVEPGYGTVQGVAIASLLDHIYFSAITYTTVGYGDVFPVGPIRFLAGTEALTGFVMITWSASFTYLEMERFWGRR
ncbi:MAG: potassium channel family protein [Rhodanobacteraceae bacterium]